MMVELRFDGGLRCMEMLIGGFDEMGSEALKKVKMTWLWSVWFLNCFENEDDAWVGFDGGIVTPLLTG